VVVANLDQEGVNEAMLLLNVPGETRISQWGSFGGGLGAFAPSAGQFLQFFN